MKVEQLLLLFILIILLSGCISSVESSQSPITIMKEVKNEIVHYRLYTDGETIFLEDIKKHSIQPLRKCNESIKPILALPTIEKEHALQFSINIAKYEEVYPFTYSLPLKLSAQYLYSLIEKDWFIAAEYANHLYRDTYLQKEEAFKRVIIFKDKIKIFENISNSVPDPWSFIVDE